MKGPTKHPKDMTAEEYVNYSSAQIEYKLANWDEFMAEPVVPELLALVQQIIDTRNTPIKS